MAFTGGIDRRMPLIVKPRGSNTFTLIIIEGDAGGDGTTDPPYGQYAFPKNSVVTVTATPHEVGVDDFGWWNLDGTDVGVDNPYDVTMDSDHILIVYFIFAKMYGAFMGEP